MSPLNTYKYKTTCSTFWLNRWFMVCDNERPKGETARQPGLEDKVQRDNAGRERRMHTWLSLAGNFKVQDLNGWKKTSAVRQWMAKENREAEHMLGPNDTKQNNTGEKIDDESMSTPKQWQEIQPTSSSSNAFFSSVYPWRALLLFADYVYTECY